MGYRVQLAAAGLTFDVRQGDPPPPVPLTAPILVDPLVIGWALETGAVPPAPPGPLVLRFSLFTPDAEQLDGKLGVGSRVVGTIDPTGISGGYPIRFLGRVTDATAAIGPSGVTYAVTATDATVDLADPDVGTVDRPIEPLWARNSFALSAGGFAGEVFSSPPWASWSTNAGANVAVDKKSYQSEPVADVVAEVLADAALVTPTTGAQSWIPTMAPYESPPLTNHNGDPWLWCIDAIPKQFDATGWVPPGGFGQTSPGVWGIIWPAGTNPAGGFIDGCYVDRDSGWTAIRDAETTQQVVVVLFAPSVSDPTRTNGYVRYPGTDASRRRVVATRVTNTIVYDTPSQAGITNAQVLARTLLPPPRLAHGWSPDSFSWLVTRDPNAQAVFPAMFPQHGANVNDANRTRCYIQPFVARILRQWNVGAPTADVITGMLTAAELTITGGQQTVTFSLAPLMPDVINPTQAMRWSDLPTPAPKWNQLNPADTWASYAMAHR